METIAQKKSSPFNVQVFIPPPLKRELRRVAGDLGVHQVDLVTLGLEYILPLKRREAEKMIQAENSKPGTKRR